MIENHQEIIDDFSGHVTEQSLAALTRALHIVPDGLEAALILRFFLRIVIGVAQVLPFEDWHKLSPEDRIRSLLQLAHDALDEQNGFEISNQHVRIVPKRSRRG